jgi:hypothetical protein
MLQSPECFAQQAFQFAATSFQYQRKRPNAYLLPLLMFQLAISPDNKPNWRGFESGEHFPELIQDSKSLLVTCFRRPKEQQHFWVI